ncbi:MAG: flagellar biosynthetic protein FliR [Pseudomonadota bacterium]
MLTFTSAEINLWLASLLWPLTRILGLIAAAPVFGNSGIPASSKIGLGFMLTLIMAPTITSVTAPDPMSFAGFLILLQQLVVGLAMGFSMRIVFAGVEMAGEIMGMTMGLGFATFFDPQSQGHSSAISQFLALVATMAFLALNGHLMVLAALAESFTSVPIAAAPLGGNGLHQLALWGASIFRSGVQLSLPIVAALLITNTALGILTRAAPQLNLFGIGFPITIGVGFMMIALVLPYMAMPLERMIMEGVEMSKTLFTSIPTSIPTKNR